MKKLVTILFVIAVTASAFIGCEKAISNKYSGTYTGNMISGTDSSQVKKENIKILITNSVTDESILYMDGLALTKNSDNQYSLSGTQLAFIIKLVFSDVSGDKIENANCVLNFSENKLDMDITYKLLDIVEVTAIKYTGVKTAEAE